MARKKDNKQISSFRMVNKVKSTKRIVGISKRETINNFLEIANKIIKNTTVYDTNKTSTDLGELTQYIVDNYEIKKK